MTWILVGLSAWLAAGIGVGVVIGKVITRSDEEWRTRTMAP
jgi:uncharacterized membrane-anchored protein YhcB (DUF1043 family)